MSGLPGLMAVAPWPPLLLLVAHWFSIDVSFVWAVSRLVYIGLQSMTCEDCLEQSLDTATSSSGSGSFLFGERDFPTGLQSLTFEGVSTRIWRM